MSIVNRLSVAVAQYHSDLPCLCFFFEVYHDSFKKVASSISLTNTQIFSFDLCSVIVDVS